MVIIVTRMRNGRVFTQTRWPPSFEPHPVTDEALQGRLRLFADDEAARSFFGKETSWSNRSCLLASDSCSRRCSLSVSFLWCTRRRASHNATIGSPEPEHGRGNSGRQGSVARRIRH